MFAKSAVIVAAAVAALGLLAAQPAPAEPFGADGDIVQVPVSYGDLDLSSPAGAQEMLRRIHRAATKVCGPEPTDRLSFQRQYDECVRETVNRAVVNMRNPDVATADGAPMAVADTDRG
jgi:UrcA family protein